MSWFHTAKSSLQSLYWDGCLVFLVTVEGHRFNTTYLLPWGFPGGSDRKESACNAGDLDSIPPSLIPGSGRSPGVGKGNFLQHSGLENSTNRGDVGYRLRGHKESDMTEHTSTKQKPREKLKPIQSMKAILDVIPAFSPNPSPKIIAIFEQLAVPASSSLSLNWHIVLNTNT